MLECFLEISCHWRNKWKTGHKINISSLNPPKNIAIGQTTPHFGDNSVYKMPAPDKDKSSSFLSFWEDVLTPSLPWKTPEAPGLISNSSLGRWYLELVTNRTRYQRQTPKICATALGQETKGPTPKHQSRQIGVIPSHGSQKEPEIVRERARESQNEPDWVRESLLMWHVKLSHFLSWIDVRMKMRFYMKILESTLRAFFGDCFDRSQNHIFWLPASAAFFWRYVVTGI